MSTTTLFSKELINNIPELSGLFSKEEVNAIGSSYFARLNNLNMDFSPCADKLRTMIMLDCFNSTLKKVQSDIENVGATLRKNESTLAYKQDTYEHQIDKDGDLLVTIKKLEATIKTLSVKIDGLKDREKLLLGFSKDHSDLLKVHTLYKKTIVDASSVELSLFNLLYADTINNTCNININTLYNNAMEYNKALLKCPIDKDGTRILSEDTKKAYMNTKTALKEFGTRFSVAKNSNEELFFFNKGSINFNQAETMNIISTLSSGSVARVYENEKNKANGGKYQIVDKDKTVFNKMALALTLGKLQGVKFSIED